MCWLRLCKIEHAVTAINKYLSSSIMEREEGLETSISMRVKPWQMLVMV